MERQKLRLVEHIVIVAFCAATSALMPHPEAHANETGLEKPTTIILPEKLSQYYRNLRFLSYQPNQHQNEPPPTTSISRLSSVNPTQKFTPEDVLKARASASPLVQCAIDVEDEGTGYDPYAIGKEEELGPGQLHPQGKLVTFYKAGYGDPYNPYQVVAFMEEQFALGDANHWAGPRDGICQ